jgi:hypothetical protein
MERCKHFKIQKVTMPNPADPKDCILKFRNYSNRLKVPYVIYADFESILNPIEESEDEVKKTKKVQSHQAASFCYIIVDYKGELLKPPVTYRGPAAASRFISMLLKEEEEIVNLVANANAPLNPMTPEQKADFENATQCHICRGPLNSEDKKHLDHCHLTGKSCHIFFFKYFKILHV